MCSRQNRSARFRLQAIKKFYELAEWDAAFDAADPIKPRGAFAVQYDLNFYLDRFITNDKSKAQNADGLTGWRNILIDESVPGKDGAVEIVEQDTYAFPMIDNALKARAVCHAHTSCCARAMLAARRRARAPTPDRAVRSTICTSAWSCSRCIRAPDPTSARAHTQRAMTAACRRARSEHASPTARHRYRTALKT